VNKDSHSGRLVAIVALLVVLVLVVWAFSAFVMFTVFPEPAERGQVGDTFGAVNSLFTGLAFLGIVVSLMLQLRDLRQQREELRLSRSAQQDTAKALGEQHDRMREEIWLSYILARSRILMVLTEYETKFGTQKPRPSDLKLKSELESCLAMLDEVVKEIQISKSVK